MTRLKASRHRGRPSPATIHRGWWLAAALVAGLVLLPPAYLVWRALGAGPAALEALFSARTGVTMLRTLGLAAAVTAGAMLIALPLAWLTVKSDLPFHRFWSVATALPLVIPSYVGAYLFVSALGPRGMLARWLADFERLGIERLPSVYGFPGAFVVLTLFTYPYLLLILRAALLRMDPALDAASRSLGEGRWGTFRRITLPQLKPAFTAGSLLVSLYVLRDFGAVSILRYNTFTRVIYVQYGSAFDRNAAALTSLALMALAFGVVLLERGAQRRARYHGTTSQPARNVPREPLGPWRWPALVFCGLVTGLGVVLPTLVLCFWLWRGLRAGEALPEVGPAIIGTLGASGLAAVLTLAAAMPIAWLAVRHGGRPGRWLMRLTWIGYALPGVVVALALVFFGVRFARPLYQSLLMLVLAYVLLFLPQAAGALRTALLQIHPSLEEAARSLGRSSSEVLREITLPLASPGVAAGLGLVFLTAMKELPATLILSPIGFESLAIEVWSAVGEAFFARAALPALLLILLSSLPMTILVLRERVEG